jgi:hypothetical protein
LGVARQPHARNHPTFFIAFCIALIWLSLSASAIGQNCQSAADMEAPVRSAIEAAATRYFEMSAHGDVAGLKQNSIAALAGNFSASPPLPPQKARFVRPSC